MRYRITGFRKNKKITVEVDASWANEAYLRAEAKGISVQTIDPVQTSSKTKGQAMTVKRFILTIVAVLFVGFAYEYIYNNGLSLPHFSQPTGTEVEKATEDELKNAIKSKAGNDCNVNLTGYSLVHKSGNEYNGFAWVHILQATELGGNGSEIAVFQVAVTVLLDTDGKYIISWERM